VRDELRRNGWFVIRAAGSLGCADLVALRAGVRPIFVEVKSTAAGPYEHFGPEVRDALLAAAKLAGADAWLCWWPSRGKATWIHADGWPRKLR
jgi:Holliday junction resolvase